jgi:acyl-CoA thioesterase FadM
VTTSLLGSQTTTQIRPHYEGSNIGSWIGFKHINQLAQEAVLEHFRAAGLPARRLYEDYGLCAEIVDLGTRIHTGFHLDDLVEATVRPVTEGAGMGLAFEAGLSLRHGAALRKAATARLRVALRNDAPGEPAAAVPPELVPFTVSRIVRTGPAPDPVPSLPSQNGNSGGSDPVLAALTCDGNTFARRLRIPYPYCHYTERVHMSGYLREMEEVVDLFLADRGVSVKRLLDERGWIPVVPHSAITLLDEAIMEEDLYTVFTVENIFKSFTYAARMDTYVLRQGQLVRTATGHITHGYAEIRNRREFGLVKLDQRMIDALGGGQHAA